jgi:uncharacterized protein (TIGR03546 family)
MIWLRAISTVLKILRDGQTPGQIAGGLVLGSFLGLSPMFTLQGLCIWLVVFALDVNLSTVFLSVLFFSFTAYLFDPLFHRIGFFLLVEVSALKGLWTYLYNTPVAPLTRFYNTVVLGSFTTAALLAAPLFFGTTRLVHAYRSTLYTTVEHWKVYRIVQRSSIVRWYLKIRDWEIGR